LRDGRNAPSENASFTVTLFVTSSARDHISIDALTSEFFANDFITIRNANFEAHCHHFAGQASYLLVTRRQIG
jgi:hypothetical protein